MDAVNALCWVRSKPQQGRKSLEIFTVVEIYSI
jgi:hypothetical protein